MAGTVPMSGATTTLTITHTAAITDAYVAQNKIVRSAGSWFETSELVRQVFLGELLTSIRKG
jgi:hypothetical protein